ncbi:MAG: KEOPS complex subunit Pcc1 [Nanoarchaeota archaeon]|nr:KEOPS complex subunit Pcc1 [Nanoarchaeota archaeon]
MYRATINVPYSETLFKAFIPEDKKVERFEYKIKKTKKELIFDITAKDSVALRASLNSIAKLISVHEKIEHADLK